MDFLYIVKKCTYYNISKIHLWPFVLAMKILIKKLIKNGQNHAIVAKLSARIWIPESLLIFQMYLVVENSENLDKWRGSWIFLNKSEISAHSKYMGLKSTNPYINAFVLTWHRIWNCRYNVKLQIKNKFYYSTPNIHLLYLL